MSQPIGQVRLLKSLNNYNAATLPKTLLFIGDKGCGKKTFAKYLADKFQFDFVEIEESVKAEDIQDFMYSTINTIYLINLDNFTEKQHNQFLKITEEPSKSVYFILTTSAEATILPTILNRCIKFYFDPYTVEELKIITGNTVISTEAVKIFKTPGKLMNLSDAGFKTMLVLADELVKNIHLNSYANTLSISTRINYKDLYDKVDFYLFFDVIEYLAFEDYKNTANKRSFIVYKVTNQFKRYTVKTNLIKEILMLNYLTTLWEAIHDIN